MSSTTKKSPSSWNLRPPAARAKTGFPNGVVPVWIPLSMPQVAGVEPLGRYQRLSDAGEEAIIEDPEAGAHDRAGGRGIGQPDARLKIVQIVARHERRRIGREVVTKSEGERQLLCRPPLVLAEEAVRIMVDAGVC